MTRARIKKYIEGWLKKGYPEGIPDEVPTVLMNNNLAPSYKAIALALLRNDMNMTELGFTSKKSKWYGAYKRVELAERERLRLLKDEE